jgi:hypothetical protein
MINISYPLVNFGAAAQPVAAFPIEMRLPIGSGPIGIFASWQVPTALEESIHLMKSSNDSAICSCARCHRNYRFRAPQIQELGS